MEPHGRYEEKEKLLEYMIHMGGYGDATLLYLNNSGERDPEFDRRDSSGEREAHGSGGTLNIKNFGEVHIYVN